jgi:hypothetical protein
LLNLSQDRLHVGLTHDTTSPLFRRLVCPPLNVILA